jgi:probable HAF family extracellular repeat protein
VKTILVIFWMIISVLHTQAVQYQVIDLGDLGIEAGAYSTSYGINNSGQVVGASSYLKGTGGNPHPFLYSNGIMSELGGLSVFGGYAQSINSSGQVTGLSYTNNVLHHAFLYSNGVMQDLGTLGGDRSVGNAINTIGQIVGGSSTSTGQLHAFMYSNGVMQDLGTLGGTSSTATAINSLGQIVGRSFLPGNSVAHAFVYSNGVMQDLSSIPGSWNTAMGINDSGQIIGYNGTSGGDSRAFLYSNGITVDLGILGDVGTSLACGINNLGQIVGQSEFENPDHSNYLLHAFLFSDGSMKDLNSLVDPSWNGTISRAYDINELGQIAAEGYGLDGQVHAFLLNPIPEPMTLSLFCLSSLILMRRKR